MKLKDCFVFSPLPTNLNDILNTGVHLKRKLDAKTSPKLCDDNTFVGIEVEVERVLTTTPIGKLENSEGVAGFIWKNVEDNSLRNNGREYVSIPLKGDNIAYALDVLESTLKNSVHTKGHEFSDRTSVHVHVNMRDMTGEELATFMLTYLLVEPLLYQFSGGIRYNNIFCVPVLESPLSTHLREMFSFVGKSDKTVFNILANWHKYTGLNCKPLSNYGTIEFRHMAGTCDADYLLKWIDLILQIKQFAIATPFKDLKEVVSELNTTSAYSHVLVSIFGENAGLLQQFDTQKDMERAVCFIKDCLYGDKNNDLFHKYMASNFDKQSSLFSHLVSNGYVRVRESKAESYRKEINKLNDRLKKFGIGHPDYASVASLLENYIAALNEIQEREMVINPPNIVGNGIVRPDLNF
jgi:hypothetical protein